MCKPISAIMLKDRILFSNISHSHSDILAENSIKDTSITPNFVKVELYPQDGDMFSNPATWQYATDQDTFPEWYVAEVDEMRLREAAAVYIKDHIHIGIDNLVLSDGLHWIKDCKNVVLKGSASVSELINSTVEAMYDNSTVKEMYGSSTVETMCDSSTVKKLYDSSTVEKMCDCSTVEVMHDGSTVKIMYGHSTVEEMCDGSTVEEMYDSSTVEIMCDCSTVKTMRDNSTVDVMCGSSTVETMHGISTVKEMYDISTVEKMCDCSTAIIPNSWRSNDVNAKKIILCENATIKDCRTKTIYQSGDWKLVIVSPKDDSNE